MSRPPVAVLVAQYPVLSETFVSSEVAALEDLGHTVLVEARVRPERPNPEAPGHPQVAYWFDAPLTAKLTALLRLAARHPVRCARDLLARRTWAREEDVLPLRVLAPAAVRLRRAGVAHLHAHFAHGPALDALRLGRILGLPFSVTAHAWDIYRDSRNLPAKLREAAFSTSGCDYTVRDLQAIAGPPADARVHRIVMGVDAQRFTRTTPYPGRRQLLAIGRLVEKKGFATLLDALARVDPQLVAHTVIVGAGPLLEELTARRDALGLADRVTLAGAQPPSAIRDLLETSDALVMPCVVAADGDRDSMPVVVKEALAMEVPVVASDEVGLPEVVREPWGYLAAPGDPAALAAAITTLMALPASRRAQAGSAGRAFVQEQADVATQTARLSALIAAARPAAGRPGS